MNYELEDFREAVDLIEQSTDFDGIDFSDPQIRSLRRERATRWEVDCKTGSAVVHRRDGTVEIYVADGPEDAA